MIYDKPPFAVVGRKSLGVEAPGDLEGKKLGAPPPDGAWAQFPAFASANGLDMSKITVEPVGFPTREPMLAEGAVDAVTGFSFSSYLNLVRLGVPEDDISTILMADYGLQLYGNAIIVNTDWAAENPDTLKAFIAALIDRNPAADAELEKRRLQLALDANVMTEWVGENGFGPIDPVRLEESLGQIAETYEFQGPPSAKLYFDAQYLPEGGFALQ